MNAFQPPPVINVNHKSSSSVSSRKIFLIILIIIIIGALTMVGLLLGGVFDENTPVKDLPVPQAKDPTATVVRNSTPSSNYTLPQIQPTIPLSRMSI